MGLLVTLLGFSLGSAVFKGSILVLPESLAVAGLLVVLTIVTSWLQGPRSKPSVPAAEPLPWRTLALGPILLLLLGVGVVSSRFLPAPPAMSIPLTLYALVGLVTSEVHLDLASVRRAGRPVVAAVAAAVVAGTILALGLGEPLSLSWAVAFGFGWYTLTGPLVALRYGATWGLIAFLANFFRESLTMALAPILGRIGGARAIAAVGGATSMDTTLYFVHRYGGDGRGDIGLATGLTLTVLAGLVVPALLALPPP